MEINISKVVSIYQDNNLIPFAMLANEYGIVLQFHNDYTISQIYDLVGRLRVHTTNDHIGSCEVSVEFGENFTEIYLNFK